MKFSGPLRLFLLALPLVAGDLRAGVEVIPTQGRNIYRLAAARMGTAPADVLVDGSTYDNRVCAFTAAGAHQWDAELGAFAFDLATGDLDGDGRDEIVVAGADGLVSVFDATGRKLWITDLQAPVYQVAVARLDGKNPVVLAGGISRQIVACAANGTRQAVAEVDGMVRVLRAGDFDGDGADEVGALVIRGQAQDIRFFKGPKLERMAAGIARGTHVGDPLLSLRSANGVAGDLDGDGAAEFIFTPAINRLRDGAWQSTALPGRSTQTSYAAHYNMRLLAQGELTSSAGRELVLVEGPVVRLCDQKGRELGRATAPLGFTAVAYLPGSPRGSVILGSSPNGDDNLYRLTFEPGWEKSLARLERHGRMADIGATLRELGTAARQWRGEPMRGADGPFDVIVNHTLWSGWNPKKFDTWIAEVRDYERDFPYPRLRFATAFWPGEDAPLLRPDGKPWGRDRRLAHDLTRAQIVAAARHFEQKGCAFWVQVGHGCDPHLEVATVAAMLKAAPTMLLGFIDSEAEQPEVLPYYLEHHIKPILELSLAHGKRFIIRNKNVWWAYWPADPRVRELIFNGRYRSVILPSVEDSNSRSPDLNLAARVGLWLDGQVDGWASRAGADWFSFNRAWEWEYPLTGHPTLRYYTAQAMLGARTFLLMNGERERTSDRWTPVGREGAATFLHLLGRGVITPPRREQLRAVSPVALEVRQPSLRFRDHGTNGHRQELWNRDGTDLRPWAFDRLDCYWGMAPLPPTDVSTYLWGRTRRDASHLLTSAPHGFVALVPGGVSRPDGPWKTVWTTDGDTLSKDGRSYPLMEARTALLADLADAEKLQPFQVEGRVFHQVVEESPGSYIVTLIDPGWVDPAERAVRLSTRLPGRWTVTDRLTGQTLGALDAPLELPVPAGALRVLEVRGP